jgi:thiol-disulfide isomerase/thioredoxin
MLYCNFYRTRLFNNIEFNTIDISTIQNKLSSYYNGSFTYENLKTKSKESLELGSMIKDFKGKSFIIDSTIIFPKKGKIYVIDFWYTSCLSCIQAIPTINKLYDKYKHNENIVFLGVYSLISDVEDKSKIEKFIKRTPIDYPIILANANDIKDLLIHQYPTFYIIDRDGKLVFKQIGYNPNEDFYNIVDEKLSKM